MRGRAADPTSSLISYRRLLNVVAAGSPDRRLGRQISSTRAQATPLDLLHVAISSTPLSTPDRPSSSSSSPT